VKKLILTRAPPACKSTNLQAAKSPSIFPSRSRPLGRQFARPNVCRAVAGPRMSSTVGCHSRDGQDAPERQRYPATSGFGRRQVRTRAPGTEFTRRIPLRHGLTDAKTRDKPVQRRLVVVGSESSGSATHASGGTCLAACLRRLLIPFVECSLVAERRSTTEWTAQLICGNCKLDCKLERACCWSQHRSSYGTHSLPRQSTL
jgi:hypothetical protein